MNYELLYPGAFCMLKAQLEDGETLKAESGAMIAMSDTVDVSGKMEGGFLKGITRMLAGEKFFFQSLTAERGPGEVLLAHGYPGEIYPITLKGKRNYILQKDGFFAGTEDIEINTTMQNLTKGLFS